MRAFYISIHWVIGIIGLPDDNVVELLSPSRKFDARAFLTVDRERYYLHLRRSAAFGQMLASTLIGQGAGVDVKLRFAAALAGNAIAEGLNFDKPLLVVEASVDVENSNSDLVGDLGEIGFGFNLFDQTALAEQAKATLEAAAAGLSLALPAGTTPTIEKVGQVAFRKEPDGRLLYLMTPSASTSMRSMTSVTRDTLTTAAGHARIMRARPSMKTVARLLSQSFLATDNLLAFLTAWAGLEAFVTKSFKDTYEPHVYKKFSSAGSSAGGPFVARLRDVMKSKYNIRDKFVLVASELDEADADDDIKLFKQLKDARDGVHEMRLAPGALPTAATQRLLQKYLRLHLQSTAGKVSDG